MARLCEVSGISRTTLYRHAPAPGGDQAGVEVLDRLQELACKCPCYRYRRLTAALEREGFRVNRKQVLRLMRDDNLLCLRKKRFVTTSDSALGPPVYPNLAVPLEFAGLDQL